MNAHPLLILRVDLNYGITFYDQDTVPIGQLDFD